MNLCNANPIVRKREFADVNHNTRNPTSKAGDYSAGFHLTAFTVASVDMGVGPPTRNQLRKPVCVDYCVAIW